MKVKSSGRVKIVLWVLLGLAVMVGSATAAYAAHYSSRALPGVSIAGVQITGQTQDEVAQGLAERANDLTITLTLDSKTSKLKLADLGYTIDAKATAAEAFAANAEIASKVSALFTARDVPVVVVTDKAKAQATIDELVAEIGVPAHDASVALAEDGTSFVVTPDQPGTSVDRAQLDKSAKAAAETLTSQSLTLKPSVVQPRITTSQAQQVADAANSLAALEVSVAGRVDSHAASAVQRAQWVSIPSSDTGLGSPTLNDALVSEWIQSASQATEVDAVAGIRNVNSNGTVVSTPQEGVRGWKVNNTAAITEAALAALHAGQPYAGTFLYDSVEPTYQTRVIAAGAENLVYQAAPNEKWIDLNLSNNSVTAYVGSTVAMGQTYIVPGMPGMETPTGKFNVYLKYASQTMRGTNLDGTPYVAENVPWVTYFTGSIAFHGAPWRDSFGWSGPGGSHGCVNMPVDAAQFIYNWAPNGTVVVSHY